MTISLANGFLATLSILASGYVLYTAPVCRFWWPRVSGSALYFRSIATGFAFFYLCYLSIYALIQFNLSPLELKIEHITFLAFPSALVLWTVITLGFWMYAKNNINWKQKFTLKSLRKNELDKFVYQQLINKGIIMITLENNKVYIGWPVEIINEEDSKWLGIIPMWSGYRDLQKGVHIQTNYSTVFGDQSSNQNRMLISVEKIVTVQPFDEETFIAFNPDLEPTANNPATP